MGDYQNERCFRSGDGAVKNIQLQNLQLKKQFTYRVLEHVRDTFGGLVMSSSFGEHSAAMLHIVTSRMPDIPVVNVRLGGESESTERHRQKLTEMLDLNLHVYNETEDQSKSEVFDYALKDVGTRTLLSGLMWEETQHRRDFEYVMFDKDEEIHRVHPILHWKERDIMVYLKKNGLPVNVGYYDPNKEESEKKECGIHVFDYQQEGSGI